jgi:hypothetical protein
MRVHCKSVVSENARTSTPRAHSDRHSTEPPPGASSEQDAGVDSESHDFQVRPSIEWCGKLAKGEKHPGSVAEASDWKGQHINGARNFRQSQVVRRDCVGDRPGVRQQTARFSLQGISIEGEHGWHQRVQACAYVKRGRKGAWNCQ